jgi:hypothetical protein
MTEPAAHPRGIAAAFALDVVLVVAFVAIGRNNHHDPGSALGGTAKIAAPFLIALVIGWLAARGWKAPAAPSTGIVVWLVTVALGMVLRHFVFSRGTALGFIIVAGCFNLATLVGWRMLGEWRRGRRAPSTP